jgi:uncharacterized protein (DUF2062 family)
MGKKRMGKKRIGEKRIGKQEGLRLRSRPFSVAARFGAAAFASTTPVMVEFVPNIVPNIVPDIVGERSLL